MEWLISLKWLERVHVWSLAESEVEAEEMGVILVPGDDWGVLNSCQQS